MDTHTNEKSLVVANNSIFTKLKRFFMRIFIKKQIEVQETQKIEEYKNNEEKVESESKADETKKTGKLFNYDNYVDDDFTNNIQDNNIDSNNDDFNGEETQNFSDGYFDEERSSVYKEKEELERKLMNYYASITKGINSNE